MSKNRVLKIVNPLLLICLINQVLTGFFSGSLDYNTFETMHKGGGILLALVAAAHIALNWSWIRTSYISRH